MILMVIRMQNINLEDLDISLLKNFKDYVKTKVDDPRQPWKTEYKLWDILVTSIVAILCNNDEVIDMYDFIVSKKDFFKQFLKLTNGIASSWTYERVLSLIDPDTLQDCLNYFNETVIFQYNSKKDIVSLDGKTDNGSARNTLEKIKPLNVLSAYSDNQSACLYSMMIDEKTNEIPTVPEILDKLKLKDVIVTWDALNTQTNNIKAVIERGGDYVVPVKANQGNFYNDLELYFKEDVLDEIRIGKLKSTYKKVIEKTNSKVITYEYFQTEDVKWYFDIKSWKKLNTFGLVQKTIDNGNEVTIEKRYYISSLFNDIELFSRAIRTHWNIENKLHWHLDFTFKQDDNTTMNKRLLFNIQLIKKFCLTLLEKVKQEYKISFRRIRHKLELNPEIEVPKLFMLLANKTTKIYNKK